MCNFLADQYFNECSLRPLNKYSAIFKERYQNKIISFAGRIVKIDPNYVKVYLKEFPNPDTNFDESHSETEVPTRKPDKTPTTTPHHVNITLPANKTPIDCGYTFTLHKTYRDIRIKLDKFSFDLQFSINQSCLSSTRSHVLQIRGNPTTCPISR